ncbi:MAG TPA: hypothetical protein VMW16_11555 [Sedimentisphaerales bacterium]|nr:hypothetical protein [Sedimentisphaerales bacterium]
MRNLKSKLFILWIVVALLGALVVSPAEGARVKWRQPPDKTRNGIDIRCDRNDGFNRTLADDFKCTTTGYITDVHIWGSWKNDVKGKITLIHLSIHKDIPANPADPCSYSMPGAVLWEKDFFAGDFKEVLVVDLGDEYEWWWDTYKADLTPAGDHQIWRYDVYIKRDVAFKQLGTGTSPVIYWLDVYVKSDAGEFGWKVSSKHWNDDAAYLDTSGAWRELRYPAEHPYHGESIDMAFAITTPPPPHIVIDSFDQWLDVLRDSLVRPVDEANWADYMLQWDRYRDPDMEPYPQNMYLEPNLYAYPGDPCPDVCQPPSPGLVMTWAGPSMPAGPYAAAWKLKYPSDPDLTNSIITVTVLPPCDPCITVVSFGMKDVNGFIRAWYWDVPAVLPCGIATTITIDTSIPGVTAANPVATSYMNNPGFDITQVIELIFDENTFWLGGTAVPPPGSTIPRAWNYWYDLTVTPKPVKAIGPRKWTQPPKRIAPGRFLGWDEQSVRYWPPLMADDWHCKDQRPVTDIHWWGSHLGWTDSNEPPVAPIGFHFGIWTDVPEDADDPTSFSHPGEMIWEYVCYDCQVEFVGYDKDPRQVAGAPPIVQDSCFQYYCDLPQDVWFYQKPDTTGHGTIYWLSIAAIYESGVNPEHPWGCKTRPHFFNDDAVRIFSLDDGNWPPFVGDKWRTGQPVEYPDGVSWDLAFELTTKKPDPPPIVDYDFDNIVNWRDFAFWADWWLVDFTEPLD